MKTDREPNDIDGLLNAVLGDDEWRTLNGALKNEAVAAMGATRRRRRLLFRMGQAACAAALLIGAGWWLLPPAPGHGRAVTMSGQPTLPGTGKQFISEEEMLAMFPAGSCVVAEVNGQKTLVFFDAKKAVEGFAWSNQ
jgi:hypothetical protein